MWPEARSVIALGMSYAPEHDPLALAGDLDRARISIYAQGQDYHDTVKKALKALARWLVEQAPGSELKVFVDTAPVMEKPLAEAAGIGWQGKHTILVNREHGNWLFLGASGANSSEVMMIPRNSQLPWVRDSRLLCLPCQPIPAAADSGFSITGAVSTNTLSWHPASSASQRPIAFKAFLTTL